MEDLSVVTDEHCYVSYVYTYIQRQRFIDLCISLSLYVHPLMCPRFEFCIFLGKAQRRVMVLTLEQFRVGGSLD